MQSEIIILVVLLALSGFFSGIETALVSITPARIAMLVRKKVRHAAVLHKVKDDPHRMLSTILIGNNLVNIAAAAIMTNMMISLNYPNAVSISTGVLTLLILVFGEITPKSIATRYSEQISLATAPVIHGLSKVFFPIIWVLDQVTLKVINKVMGPAPKPKITEEELKNYIKLSEQSGSINKDETEMLQNIIEFEDTTVKTIMTPRPQIKKVVMGTAISDVVNLIVKTGHSRVPVFDKRGQKVQGVIIGKDLLPYMTKGKLKTLVDTVLRKVHFVPETKKLDELFKEFKHGKTHMAIVVDEYGAVTGLVTLEDLLEEIVGDLFDETDKELKQIHEIREGEYRISGLTYLDDVNEMLGLKLESESDVESVGGWVVEKLGKIPAVNDVVKDHGLIFTVKGVVENRVKDIHLEIHRRTRKN